jgi:predicted metal-dependent peptidase
LWDEDEAACCDINGFIEVAQASNTWGTIPGKLQGLIKASMKVDMDYRKMLSLFKTSVISSRRHLTRMRPNRRSGFDAMGSRYELSTNLLIAVDVSGSVTDKSLEFFFSVINRLFKYGIEKLDVLQFDAAIQGEIEPFKKARRTVKILGRGGTWFQPAADYYCEHPEYDGLIYFTDGYAPPPVFNTKRPIDVLWVLCSKQSYEANGDWIRKMKRNRVTYIPRSE